MQFFKDLPGRHLILLILIFFAGSFIRLSHLGQIPIGLTNDEANVGYDAYSILKTGKDQWGHNQPSTALVGFGDYRPPVYTYMVIPSVALFGLNEFAVRLPAALAGSFTVLLVYFLAMQLWRKPAIGIVAMGFVAFNPWHIGMSRAGIESTFGVFLITTALTLFLTARTKQYFLFPAIFLFAVTVYTYPSYIILSPLLVLLLFWFYRREFSLRKKSGVFALIFFFVLLLPLVTGGNATARARSRQVNLTSDIGIVNIVNDKRGECLTRFNPRICQIFENKFVAYVSAFTFNYLNHFSPDLLMKNGTPTQYSVLPPRGLLLTTEYLLFIAGVILLLRRRQREDWFLLLWIFLSPLPDSLTGAGHYSRYLPIIPAIQLVSAFCIYEIWTLVKKRRMLVFGPIFAIFCFEVVAFFLVYTTYFPRFFATSSHYGYKQLIDYLVTNHDKFDKLVISSAVNDTKQYVYYLFYTKYDPALFQKSEDIEKVQENGGWTRVTRIGKIYFLPSISLTSKDYKIPVPHILLAGAKSEFPKTTKITYTIKDPKNNPIFILVDTAKNPWLLPKK
ncbi:MAG: glycosyltransferase family 39 protein [bacterium]|nr:glycosyltransferase family 39 protein [bacterium]